MIKYSFVLPAYKGAHIADSIESILCQTYTDFELIIVDDCSPDDIKSVTDKFQDPRIKYYRNDINLGGTNLVRQWNYCIDKAIGTFLILASDDDLYEPDYLLKMDSLEKTFPTVNVFRPLICHIDEVGRRTICEEPMIPQPGIITQEYYLELFSNHYLLSGLQQYMFRRSSLLEIGGFVDLPRAWFSDDATVICLSKNS